MSARYGGGDALRSGWAGLQASGMKTGQYSEYLRAMQRVMEDGISKGFIRSSEQVARNLTMLSMMTNNNPLWQGENGARRLSEINSGLEGATGLQDSSQVIAFKAAMEIANSDAEVKKRGGRAANYGDAMKILENPGDNFRTLFDRINKLFKEVEGDGNIMGFIEHLRNLYGWSYTTADAVAHGMIPSDQMLKSGLNSAAGIPNASSPELDFQKVTQELRNIWTENGQPFFETKLNEIINELKNTKNLPPEIRDTPIPSTALPAMLRPELDTARAIMAPRTSPLNGLFDPSERREKDNVNNIIRLASLASNRNQNERAMARQVNTWLQELPDITAGQMNRDNSLNNIRDISQLYTLLERLINETSSVSTEINFQKSP